MVGLNCSTSLSLDKENAIPELKCILLPPDLWNLPEPSVKLDNCRITVKDSNGKLLDEQYKDSNGRKETPEKVWTEPIAWSIWSDYFFNNKIPGKYSVEMEYRNYFPRDNSQGGLVPGATAIQYPLSLYVFSPELGLRKDADHALFQELKPIPIEEFKQASNKGRWIAFVKKFTVVITADKKMELIDNEKDEKLKKPMPKVEGDAKP
jgi:hypothetical protein